MNRCITPAGSTTSRWLAAANRLYSSSTSAPQPPSHDEDSAKILSLLSRWKPTRLLRPQNLDRSLLASPVPTPAEQNHLPPIPPHEPFPEVPQTISYKPLLAAATTIGNDSQPTIYERPTLPVSPFMDPNVIAAKEKHYTRKALPSKNPELFQQMLTKNPYARALATPLRRCQLTLNALPSFFLQDFKLMAHPETGTPWWVPSSLANKKALARVDEDADLEMVGDRGLEQAEDTETNAEHKQIRDGVTPTVGYSVYTLAYQHALRAIQDPKGYGKKQSKRTKGISRRNGITTAVDVLPARFIPDRYRQSKNASKFLGTAKWRSDMHEFVLDLMRRRVVETLVHVTNLKRGYVVGCSGWEDALAKLQVGAFLWTGRNGEEEMDVPPEFATLDVSAGRKEERKTRKVPVHNLRRLLGKDKLAELREILPSGIFEREVVVIKRKQQLVNLEMQLWKLQGYLADYRDLEERPFQDLEEDKDEEDEEEDGSEEGEDERGMSI